MEHERLATLNSKLPNTNPKPGNDRLASLNSGKTPAPLSQQGAAISDAIKGIDHAFLDEATPLGLSVNEKRAAAQSTLEKWGHGLAKGVGTFVSALGETAGILGGGIVATTMAALGNEFDSDIVFKNPVITWFHEANEEIIAKHPNYYSQAEINASVLSNMGTANFWSDKVINGIGFLASALVGAKGAGLIGRGLGLGAKGTKIGTSLNTFQSALVGRMGESGIEANETYEQTIVILEGSRLSGANNYSDEEIEDLAKDARAAAFGFNMMLAIPDAYQLGKIFKAVKGQSVGKSIFGKGRIAHAAEQLIIESQEENYQLAVSNMAIKMANTINNSDTKAGAGEYLSNIVGGMLDNFRTKEGQEAMVLGGLLGGGMGLAFNTNDRSDLARNHQSDTLIRRNNILVNALNNDIEAEALKRVAIEKNDLVSAVLIEDMQLTNLIYSKMVTGKIEELIKDVEATSEQTPEQFNEAFGVEITQQEIASQKVQILHKIQTLKTKYALYSGDMHEAVKGNLLYITAAQDMLRSQLIQLSATARAVETEIEQRQIPDDQLNLPITLANGDTVIPESILKEVTTLQSHVASLNKQVTLLNSKTAKGKAAREEIIGNTEDLIPKKKPVKYKESIAPAIDPAIQPNLEDDSILDDLADPDDLVKRVQIHGESGKIYKVLKEVTSEEGDVTLTLQDLAGMQKVVPANTTQEVKEGFDITRKTNIPPFDIHEIIKNYAKHEPALNKLIENDPNWAEKIRLNVVISDDKRTVPQRLADFNTGKVGLIKDSNVHQSNDGMLLIPSTGVTFDLSMQLENDKWVTIGHPLDPNKFTDSEGNPLDFSEMTEEEFFEKFRFRNAATGEGEIDTTKWKAQVRGQEIALNFQAAVTDWVANNNIVSGTPLPQEFVKMFLTKKGFDHTAKGEFSLLTDHTMLQDENGNYTIVDTRSMTSIIDGGSHSTSIPKADLLALEGNNRYLIRAIHPTLGAIWIKAVPKAFVTKAQEDSILNTKDKGINEIRLKPTKSQIEELNANLFIAYEAGWNFAFESTVQTKGKIKTLKLNIHNGNERFNITLDRPIKSLLDLSNIIQEGTKGTIQLDPTSYKKSISKDLIDNKTAEKLFVVNTTPKIVQGARIKFNFQTDLILKSLVKKKKKRVVTKTAVKKEAPQKLDLKAQAEQSQSDNDAPTEVGAFKVSKTKASSVFDYASAKEWLHSKLPSDISVKELDTAIDNIDSNDYVWGKFSDNTIFLAEEAGEGTQYHEAFHAVFRTLLSPEERKKLYALAINKWGKGKSPLAYEELMADEFMKWKADKSIIVSSPLRKFFNKLMAFAKWITGQEGALDRLFRQIDNGTFKHKTINKNSDIKFFPPAYKMLAGNKFYKMSAIVSEEIIFTTASNVMEQLQSEVYTHKQDEQRFIVSRLVNEFMDAKAILYDYTSESNKEYEGDKDTQEKLAGLEAIYNSEVNRKLIIEETNKFLSMLEISYTESQLEEADDEEVSERVFDVHQGEGGGFGSIGKEVKQFIALTTYKTTDEFGNNISKALHSTNVYYALLRRVSSNGRENLLKEFKEFAETDEQISALYEKFLAETGYDEISDASVTNMPLFNRFLNAFELVDVDYIQSLSTEDELMSISANRESSDIIHFQGWERNASESNIFKDKKSRHEASLDLQEAFAAFDLEDATDETVKQAVQSVKDAFIVIGVDLSVGYIRRSLLEAHSLRDESEKRLLTREDIVELSTLLIKKDDSLYAQRIDEDGEVVDATGARARLINIAGGDILYRTDVYETTYQDAEGKSRFSFVLPSFIFSKTREYANMTEDKLEQLRKHPYLKYNTLVQSSNALELFANLKVAFTGDYSDTVTKQANTFKSTDAKSLLLSWYGLYNRKGDSEYAWYTPMIYEAKSTAVSFKLPKTRAWLKNGKITKESKEFFFNTLFLQEHQRIQGNTGIQFVERSTPWVTLPMFNGVSYKNKLLTEYSLEEVTGDVDLKQFIIKTLTAGLLTDIQRHKDQLLDFKILEADRNSLFVPQDEVQDYITNYYLNDFINSVGISQLLTGDLAKFKSPADNVKRMGGLIAYGTHFGSGTFKTVYKEASFITNPDYVGGENNIEVDDAQVWVSVKRRLFQLERLGEVSDEAKAVYEKIDRGEKLTVQETKFVDAISLKTVYFDGDVYHKMSEFMLSREAVSERDIVGNWIAKKGKEEGHNMLEFMELNGVDTIVTSSASKILRSSPTGSNKPVGILDSNAFKDSLPEQFEVGELPNEFLRLQVKMKSGKEEIVSGTQMAQLIDLLFTSDPKLVERYSFLLAKNRSTDYEFANRMINKKRVDYSVEHIAKKLIDTLEASGGDAQIVDLLATKPVYDIVDGQKVNTGRVQFKYNLNLPHISEKIEQIFLSHMSKGVLQQKVPGHKLTLVSPLGFNKEDGTPLQIHKIKDGKVQLAEVMMTRGALRKLLKGKEFASLEDINSELLEMVGVRIPTQAHHSMIPFKIVEFLPEFYGDVIIAPAEITKLSGADYDIDSLFVYRKDFYVNEQGESVLYGSAKTEGERYEEYVKYHSNVNKTIKKALREATQEFSDTGLIPAEYLTQESEIRQLIFEEHGLHSTFKSFQGDKEQSNNGARNNELVDIYKTILTDPSIPDLFEPVLLDLIEDVAQTIHGNIMHLDNAKDDPLHYSLSGKLKAHKSIATGKRNIGAIAQANNINAFLTKGKVNLRNPIEFLGVEYNSYAVIEENDIEYMQSDVNEWSYGTPEEAGSKRTNFSKINSLSTLLSATTDDAKHGFSFKLNLELFNIVTFANMLSLGMGFKRTMMFASQPILFELSNHINTSELTQEQATAEFITEQQVKVAQEVELGEGILMKNFTRRNDSVDGAILQKYIELEEAGRNFQAVGKLLKLNKGDIGINMLEIKKLTTDITSVLKNPYFANLKKVVGDHPNTNTNISILSSIENNLGSWFLVGSDPYNKLEAGLLEYLPEFLSKKNNIEVDRALRSYITMQGLDIIGKNSDPGFSLSNFNTLVNPNIKGDTLAKRLQKLATDPETKESFIKNEAVKAINIAPVFLKPGIKNKANKTSVDQVTTNTRIKRSPLTVDRITNGFLSLSKDYKNLGRDFLRTAMVKDNLRFTNGSYLKYLDISLFKPVSDGLDKMVSPTGGSNVITEDFLKVFLTYRENEDMLESTFDIENTLTFKGTTAIKKTIEELKKDALRRKSLGAEFDMGEFVSTKLEQAEALSNFIITSENLVYYREDPSSGTWTLLPRHGTTGQLPYHMSYEEAVANDKYVPEVSDKASVQPQQEVPLPDAEPVKINPEWKDLGALSKNSTMGDVVNYNFTRAIKKLSKRFNLKVELVDQPNATWKGRYQGGIVFLNVAHLTGDTLFHEFAHPFVQAIKDKNSKLYEGLVKEIIAEETILKQVTELYPELDNDGLLTEAITTSIGLYAAETLPKTLVEKIKSFLQEMMHIIRGFFSGVDMFLPAEMHHETSLRDLGAIMSKGDQVFELGELSEDQVRYQKNQAVKLVVQADHVELVRKGEKVISLRDLDNDVTYKEGEILEIYANGKEQGLKVKVKTAKVIDNLEDVNKDDFAKALGYVDYADFIEKDKYAAEDSDDAVRFSSVYQFLQGNRRQQIVYFELVDTYNVGKDTPLSKTIKDVQEALTKQIKHFSQKITNKNLKKTTIKAFVKKRKRLLKAIEVIEDAAGLEAFVVEAHTDITKAKARLDSILSDIVDIKTIPEKQRKYIVNNIHEIQELVGTYHMIASISEDQMKEMLGETELIDKLMATKKELENLTTVIDERATPLIASWLLSMNTLSNDDIKKEMQVQIDRINNSNSSDAKKKKRIKKLEGELENMLLTQDSMEALLKQATRDIGYGSLIFEAAISSSDRVTALFAKAVKLQEFRANVADQAVRDLLGFALLDFEKEQKSKGVNPEKFYKDLYITKKDSHGTLQIYFATSAPTPKGQELLTQLKYVYKDAQDKLPESVAMGDIIPYVKKSATDMLQVSGFFATMKSEWKEITQPVSTDTAYGYQTADGKAVRQVPIFYVYRGQDNKELKNEEISKDLVSSVLMFAQMANKYEQYRKIQSEVDLFEQIIKKRTVKETTTGGAPILDEVAKKVGFDKYITSDTNRVNARIQEFINMTYYGEQEKPILFDLSGTEVDMNKLLNFLGKWTGFTTLAFNFLSAINNVILGNFYIFQESLARQHFGNMQFNLAKGKKLYYAGLPGMLGDFGQIANKSKESQLVDLYDALQGSFREATGSFITGNIAKKAFTTNSFFFANQAGEHEMQVSTLFAALSAQKVKIADGNEISLWEAYSVVDGKLELRSDVAWTEKERFNFMNKIHAINKSLHGNYNDFDKTVIQKNAIGRLVLMFRKFMAPGIRRRYGQKIVDVESGEIHEGFMRQFLRQLSQESSELANWALFKQNNLTDYEKSNLVRMVSEVGMYITTMIMFSAAVSMMGDDKDDWMVGITLYQIRRFQSELGFYMSLAEPIKIIKSPTASTSTLVNIAKFTDQALHVFWDSEYTHYQTGGAHYKKGDSKFWAATKKLIPVVQGLERSQRPGEALKYFDKLF